MPCTCRVCEIICARSVLVVGSSLGNKLPLHLRSSKPCWASDSPTNIKRTNCNIQADV